MRGKGDRCQAHNWNTRISTRRQKAILKEIKMSSAGTWASDRHLRWAAQLASDLRPSPAQWQQQGEPDAALRQGLLEPAQPGRMASGAATSSAKEAQLQGTSNTRESNSSASTPNPSLDPHMAAAPATSSGKENHEPS